MKKQRDYLFLCLFIGPWSIPALAQQYAGEWFPIIFYTSETSVALGAGYLRVFESVRSTNQRPDHISLMSFYTLNEQFLLRISPEMGFSRKRYNWRSTLTYADMPRLYFHSPESSPQHYRDQSSGLLSTLSLRMQKTMRAGFVSEQNDKTIHSAENGLLVSEETRGAEGGFINGVGVFLEWDNRNHLYWPSSGNWHSLKVLDYSKLIGSDFEFTQLMLDLRSYNSIGNAKIVALRLSLLYSTGDTPFYKQASLGGPTQNRGLYEGRHRGDKTASVQAEYRFTINASWHAVVFAAIGSSTALTEGWSTGRDLIPTGGLGLRYAINLQDKMNLRFDLGISHEGVSPIFYLKEAF